MFKVLEQPSEYSTKSDAQLLASFLDSQEEREAVILINDFGGLRQVIEASHEALVLAGLSFHEAVRLRAIRETAARFVGQSIARGEMINAAQVSKDYLSLKMRHLKHEVFACLWLDQRHRVIAYEELFRGTVNASAVYVREVVKSSLKHEAAAVIFAHNHPSGDSSPSVSDIDVTKRLQEALELVEVRVLDHIIVGDDCLSMAESGMF